MSSQSLAPWLLLNLSGYDYKLIPINGKNKEQKTDDYTLINPMQQCPAMKDSNGFCIFEQNAIMRYICRKYNLDKYYPHDPYKFAKVEMALDFKQTVLNPKMVILTYPILGFASYSEELQLKTKNEMREKVFPVIKNKFLNGNKFITGDDISIGDIAIATAFTNFTITKFWEEFPIELIEFYERVLKFGLNNIIYSHGGFIETFECKREI
eukprot:Mrub_10264.p1 GENE.Mrub_10264~~Mrub_10264.p1  ORF type:complete len:210 (+),score=19.67 Mrub_10264:3-632(+)